MGAMTIKRLADSAGVNVETVRYYQRRGLLREPPRPPGSGIRRYEEADARRLGFIRRAQAMGFSLSEIAGLADASDARGCEHTRQLAEHKLADVRARIKALHMLETELSRLIDECAETPTGCTCPALHRFGKGDQDPCEIL
jgi:MerR family mercuric resistance operon transcriptional regulator